MRLWDAQSGRSVRAWTGHDGPVWSVAVASDGPSAHQQKAIVHQLFKGNEYWFWMGTDVDSARISVHVYDSDGNLAEVEHSTRSRWVRLGIRNLRIIAHVGRALVLGKHTERAAALTYFSLLSVVPLLAVVFSLFKAFGGMSDVQGRLQAWLLENLAPGAAARLGVPRTTLISRMQKLGISSRPGGFPLHGTRNGPQLLAS